MPPGRGSVKTRKDIPARPTGPRASPRGGARAAPRRRRGQGARGGGPAEPSPVPTTLSTHRRTGEDEVDNDDGDGFPNGLEKKDMTKSDILSSLAEDANDAGEREADASLAQPGAGAMPMHWAVTAAFHAGLWYTLRYAGPALGPAELWTWRFLLQLSQGGLSGTGGAATQTAATSQDGMQWACSDEMELLLRLALRKPPSFTVTSLESAYGESFHVHAALRALEEAELLHWRECGEAASTLTSQASEALTVTSADDASVRDLMRGKHLSVGERVSEAGMIPQTSSQLQLEGRRKRDRVCDGTGRRKRTRKETLASPVLVRHTGQDVACLITTLTPRPSTGASRSCLRNSVEKEISTSSLSVDGQTQGSSLPAKQRATMEQALIHVLDACRAVDLRACASAVHRCCVAHYHHQQAPPLDTSLPQGKESEPKRGAVLSEVQQSRQCEGEESNESLVVLSGPPRDTAATTASPAALESANARHPAAAEEDDKNSGGGAIPTRKREIMLYFIERRYLEVTFAVSGGSGGGMAAGQRGSSSAKSTETIVVDLSEQDERELLAQCWNSFVGDCVTLEPAVRASVAAVAELFQLFTGNFGASGPLSTMEAHPAAAMLVAAAPTTLFMTRQLQLLARFVSAGYEGGEGGAAVAGVEEPVPPMNAHGTQLVVKTAPLWWWRQQRRQQQSRHEQLSPLSQQPPSPSAAVLRPPSGITASFAGGCDVHVELFSDSETLSEYRRALATHRSLFGVTLGATTISQKLRARDSTFVVTTYKAITEAFSVMKREAPRRVRGQIQAASRHALGEAPSLHAVLFRHGLRAQHLLQFTPMYRWYACLELIYPLLQSLHMYVEANACLHYLCHVPVYEIYPSESGAREGPSPNTRRSGGSRGVPPLPAVHFPVYYRPQKRGDWLLRIAMNATHLQQKEEALRVLENAHEDWRRMWESMRTDKPMRDTVSAIVEESAEVPGRPLVLGDDGGHGEGDVIQGNVYRKARQAEQLERLSPALQRRCRLLRAVWPDSDDGTPSRATYHACMEEQLRAYMRRADVLAMERTLSSLHKSVRKWTPLPARHHALMDEMLPARPIYVNGLRDPFDPQRWLDPVRRKHSALAVEDYVMEHLLREANAALPRTGPGHDGACKDPGEGVSKHETDVCKDEEQEVEEEGVSEWRGMHCEGAWVAYAARVLLWDAYYHPAATGVDGATARDVELSQGACADQTPVKTEESPAEEPGCDDPVGQYLWLTPFQEGPLDLLVPLEFVARRRRLLEERLAFFEKHSKAVMLAYAARHMRGKETLSQGPPASRAATISPAPSHSHGGATGRGNSAEAAEKAGRLTTRSEPSYRIEDSNTVALISDADESSARDTRDASVSPPDPINVTLAQAPSLVAQGTASLPEEPRRQTVLDTAATDYNPYAGLPLPARTSFSPVAEEAEIPTEFKVNVGAFPLLEVLRAVPKAALLRLLRCLYLSDLSEGYSVKFSGFPDLVLWYHDVSQKSEGDEENEEERRGVAAGSNDEAAAAATRSCETGTHQRHITSTSFRLIEVKSPHDVLSTKQIAMNDCLRRCGFDVSIGHVVDVGPHTGENKESGGKAARKKK